MSLKETGGNCIPVTDICVNKKKRKRKSDCDDSCKIENNSAKSFKSLWRMTDPTLISPDVSHIVALHNVPKLTPALISNLEAKNINSLFPVQAAVIHWMLDRLSPKILLGGQRDLCISSPTGSGKTLSYVLPILHLLSQRFVPSIQALIVVPTKDLALQTWSVFKTFSKCTGLKVGVLAGDVKLKEEQSRLIRKICTGELESRVDILVATPGRLVEHLKNTEGFSLEYLKFLVIDEADHVLEKKQNRWLDHVTDHIKSKACVNRKCPDMHHMVFHSWPQKLLFSATLSFDVHQFDSLDLCQPKFIIATTEDFGTLGQEYSVPRNISEYFIIAKPQLKVLVLCDLVLEKNWDKMLIFTNSNEEAHRLAYLLNCLLPPSVKVSELTKLQILKDRTEAIRKFSLGENNILVTCDRMARGIDFPGVKYVISYDPAKFFRTYVHRAGRTGRAGLHGQYITILAEFQGKKMFDRMVNLRKRNITEIKIDSSKNEHRLKEMHLAIEKLSKEVKRDQEKITRVSRKSRRVKAEKLTRRN